MPDSNAVQLETFVATALTQIVNAISQAEPEVAKHGAHINPPIYGGSASAAAAGRLLTNVGDGTRSITQVDFDIAVTAEAVTGKSAGIAAVFAAISGGAKEPKEVKDNRVSRIQFSIPVSLPGGGEMPKAKSYGVAVSGRS